MCGHRLLGPGRLFYLLQKTRQLLETKAVHKENVGLPLPFQRDHIADREAVPLEICRVVDVELDEQLLKRRRVRHPVQIGRRVGKVDYLVMGGIGGHAHLLKQLHRGIAFIAGLGAALELQNQIYVALGGREAVQNVLHHLAPPFSNSRLNFARPSASAVRSTEAL